MAIRGSFAGLRIRERRSALGLSQTALARETGISSSYLNLIEHNKRGVAGRVLIALARALDLPPSALSKEAELSLIGDLRHAAEQSPGHDAETDVTEEFVGRYPGWARLVHALHTQSDRQAARINALSDRLTHDPFLAETVHEVLTRITAVHSTADILAMSDLPHARRERFLSNLTTESARLAEVAESLATYFDQTIEVDQGVALPGAALERFLEKRKHRVEELEACPDPHTAIAAVLEKNKVLDTAETRAHSSAFLERYAADALMMPRAPFAEAAAALRYDPLALAYKFQAPVDAVLRRMATLPRTQAQRDDPLFGLIRINGAGHVLDRQPLAGFPMPRPGIECERWPLFIALQSHNRPVTGSIDLPSGLGFEALAVATKAEPRNISDEPCLVSTMLIAARDDAREMAFANC